jgi:hypothetical protein
MSQESYDEYESDTLREEVEINPNDYYVSDLLDYSQDNYDSSDYSQDDYDLRQYYPEYYDSDPYENIYEYNDYHEDFGNEYYNYEKENIEFENIKNKLLNIIDKKSEVNECVVCINNESVLCYPKCKHLCICKECFFKLNDFKKCPICRTEKQMPIIDYDIKNVIIP